jgi:hypothetical protein
LLRGRKKREEEDEGRREGEKREGDETIRR